MLLKEIPNESYEEEMRRIREKNSGEHVPTQHVPADEIFYSTNRRYVRRHRESEIQRIIKGRLRRLGEQIPSLIIRHRENVFEWRYNLGFRIYITLSAISNKARPHFIPRTSGINSVEIYNGGFP